MSMRGGVLARAGVLLGLAVAGQGVVTRAAPALPRADPPNSGQAAIVQPANVTASSLAARVTALVTEASRLEARATELDRQLVAATAKADNLNATASSETKEASSLLAAARRQAVAAYIGGDPAQQSFAMITAVGQGDVNDVTWSVGLLRSSSQRTLSLARAARSRLKFADATLTDALAERDRLADERARLDAVIAAARNAVLDAEANLEAYVKRLGPGTIIGMTTVAYDAYKHAEAQVASEQKACALRWELLAAIGKTESNHGMGRLDATGLTSPPILGIPIGDDTDKGEIDTDSVKDHAVGPMQFIPSTWRKWGADGNGDGIVDINNIYDEALSAGRYLCAAAGADTLATREGLIKAIWAYNPNADYLRTVGGRYEALASDVAQGWFSSADLPTPGSPGTVRPVTGPNDTPADQPAANVRLVRPFSATQLAVPAVSPDARPAVCGPSAALVGRAGVGRCDLPAVGAEPALALDPCVVAPYDGQLLACYGDPDQAVRLVRAAAVFPGQFADGPPYFGIVLEGGDRCLAAGTATAVAPGRSRLAANGTTTTTGGTTTTAGATTTTTTRPTTTTTARATTTTTAAPPATTTTSEASTTTTTIVTPGATLPPPAGGGAGTVVRYHCASGAEVLGNPVPGTVAAVTPTSGPPTTRAATTTIAGQTVAVPWIATVSQAGLATRAVAVLTLFA